MKKSKRTPSRIKYEQNHPTVSFRVSKELYDQLEVVKKAEGKSTTDILKIGVGLFTVKTKTEKEIWQKGYNTGYDDGVTAACDCFQVTYPCCRCGEELVVDSDGQKKAIRQFMVDQRWGHAECHEKAKA